MSTVEIKSNRVSAADFDVPLTKDEQKDIAFQLGPLLIGAGLLGLGAAFKALFPGQDAVGSALQALAALIVSFPIFMEGLRGFLARPPSDLTEQLVSLAILAAMASGDFVTATLVPLFLEIGHMFEERSARGARAAIEGIKKLHAHTATLLIGKVEKQVDPSELEVGQQVIVRPGEVIPADGKIVQGHSSVDQAPITGESVYEEVKPGSQVFSGTINLDGVLKIKATQVGSDTVLGRVLELLREVEDSKTPALRLLEKYAGVYLPLVLVVAAVTLFVSGELSRAIAVLIVSCPCALVLAGPSAMVAAMTSSTRLQVLIKSARFLETVAEVKTLILDKTGTVTAGSLSLSEVRPLEGKSDEYVLAMAATCGYGSLHPISRAAFEAAKSRGIEIEEPKTAKEIPGEGVECQTPQGVLRLGRATWLEGHGVQGFEEALGTGPGAWVALDDKVLGYVALIDKTREEAYEALQATRRLGIDRLVMLTGDRKAEAKKVAEQLGFDDYVAEVLPEQKLDIVRQEQAKGHKVMMVGDGVNDALALSGADVGVAVGARMNEVALGGADVALMTSDLERLPLMMRLSDWTRRVVLQNALIGTALSLFMMVLASSGIVGPVMGALMHNAGALFVILNSSRILRYAEDPGWDDEEFEEDWEGVEAEDDAKSSAA